MLLSSSSPFVRLPKRSLFRNAVFELPGHLMEANARQIYSCISSLLPDVEEKHSSAAVTLVQETEEEEQEEETEKKKEEDVIASDLCILSGLKRVALAAKYWIYLRWMAKAQNDSVLEASLAAVEGYDEKLSPDVKRRICRGMEAMSIFLNHPDLLKRVLAVKQLDFSAFAHLNKKELTYEKLQGAMTKLEEEEEEEEEGRRLGCRELEQAIRGHDQGKKRKQDEQEQKQKKKKKIPKQDEEEDEEETDKDAESSECPLRFQMPVVEKTKCSKTRGHVLFCQHHKEWMMSRCTNDDEEEEEEQAKLLRQLAEAESTKELLTAAVVLQCHVKASRH